MLDINKFKTMPEQDLESFGLRFFDYVGKKQLWLFPEHYYPHIPEGALVTDIFGDEERFVPGVTDDDVRGGLLAFGILREEGVQ